MTPARAAALTAETAFDAAVLSYRQARADLGRSKSAKRVQAFVVADFALEDASAALRAALDAADRADRIADRAARAAARPAAPVQIALF